MMSSADSCLLQLISDILANYFLNTNTSVIAIETTLACLLHIEAEYYKPDMFSRGYSLWKAHHLEKIRIFKENLNAAKTTNSHEMGKSAIKFLLEFYRKSEDWSVRGYIKGPSINMRLTCELLQAAGVKENHGLFLQEYAVAFLKTIEFTANKYSVIVLGSVLLATTNDLLKYPCILNQLQLATRRHKSTFAEDYASGEDRRSSPLLDSYQLD